MPASASRVLRLKMYVTTGLPDFDFSRLKIRVQPLGSCIQHEVQLSDYLGATSIPGKKKVPETVADFQRILNMADRMAGPRQAGITDCSMAEVQCIEIYFALQL